MDLMKTLCAKHGFLFLAHRHPIKGGFFKGLFLCSITVNLCSQGQEEATLGSFMQGPGNVLSASGRLC